MIIATEEVKCANNRSEDNKQQTMDRVPVMFSTGILEQ